MSSQFAKYKQPTKASFCEPLVQPEKCLLQLWCRFDNLQSSVLTLTEPKGMEMVWFDLKVEA